MRRKASEEDKPKALVISHIKQLIEDGDIGAGDIIPAERTLAEELKVSRDTIRRSYKELTRQGVIRIIGKTRRIIAAAPDTMNSLMENTFAILSDTIFKPEWLECVDMEDHFILARAAQIVEDKGFHVIFVNFPSLKKHGTESIIRARPCGYLLSTTMLQYPEVRALLQTIRDMDCACVIYGDTDIQLPFDRVYSDHFEGGRLLTSWLIQKNKRKILPVHFQTEDADYLCQRYRGYRKAMADAGLSPLEPLRMPDLVDPKRGPHPFADQVRIAAGYLAPYLSGREPVDAMMAVVDPQAYLLSAVCRQFHLVPNRDVLITGYDNSWARAIEREWESEGPFVTMNKQNFKLAHLIADMAIARVKGELNNGPRTMAMTPELLIVQDSN